MTISVEASVLSNCRIESNRKIDSSAWIESNRIIFPRIGMLYPLLAYRVTRRISRELSASNGIKNNKKVSHRKQIARDSRSRSNSISIPGRYEKLWQRLRSDILGLGPRVRSIKSLKFIGTDTERSGVCDFPLGSVENGPQNPTYYLTSPRWWWAGNRSTPVSRHITTRLRKVD